MPDNLKLSIMPNLIMPWKYQLYKKISTRQGINIEMLYVTYLEIIRSLNQHTISQNKIIDMLGLYVHVERFVQYNLSNINYQICFNHWALVEYKNKFRINKWILFTTIIDALVIILFLTDRHQIYLILARIGAVLVLTNSAYLLLEIIGYDKILPGKTLAKMTLTPMHQFYAVKIIIGSIVHTVYHIVYLVFILKKCKTGCQYSDVDIIKHDNNHQGVLMISYMYFLTQLPYITGIVLCSILLVNILAISLKRYIRYTYLIIAHKTLSILFLLTIIIHGSNQLMGFNISYVFLAPLFLAYLWKRKYIIYCKKVGINRWRVTSDYIALYLNKQKDTGQQIVVINQPLVSRIEWHSFTLCRDQENNPSLTIKRTGAWTNKLADKLLSNSIGMNFIYMDKQSESIFQYHQYFMYSFYFCAGIGITTFISIMHQIKTNVVLFWSINNISIFLENHDKLKRCGPNVKINIFFSNSQIPMLKRFSKEDLLNFHVLQAMVHEHSGIDIFHGMFSPFTIKFHRICLFDEFENIIINKPMNTICGVFICGSQSYTKNVIETINTVNSNTRKVILNHFYELI